MSDAPKVIYRISWEMPDAHTGVWHVVTRETDDPWDQYRTLVGWEHTGEQPIRAVHLERAGAPAWHELTLAEIEQLLAELHSPPAPPPQEWMCGAFQPLDGYRCTEPAGHHGSHVASEMTGEVIATWERRP